MLWGPLSTATQNTVTGNYRLVLPVLTGAHGAALAMDPAPELVCCEGLPALPFKAL